MGEADQICRNLSCALPGVKSGTLRFWGFWFGRPHDNFHRITGSRCEGNVLIVEFDDGEVLSVWNPGDAVIDQASFVISSADRVLWQWFSYGLPQTDSNRYFLDFVLSDSGVSLESNVDWYTPVNDADAAYPAVEID